MNQFWIFSFVFVIAGVYFLVLGLRGLLIRRPFVIPASQMLVVLLMCFAPSFWFTGRMLLRTHSLDFLSLFPLVMNVLLIFILWKQFNGYMAFGVTDESFRDALHHALQTLNLPFEETLSQLKLLTLDAQLQAAVQGWTGVAQIRFKQQRHKTVLRQIADAMNEYFNTNSTSMNRLAFSLYTLLGLLMVVFAVYFAFRTSRDF